jgi:CTP synthase (UTP-ammonia lyase)
VIKIAIIGDYNKENPSHLAIEHSLMHSNKIIKVDYIIDWISTDLVKSVELNVYSGFWIASGVLYSSVAGAIHAIRYSRENNIPTLGTCRGFQHIMIEFARNKLDMIGQEIEKNDPFHSSIVNTRKECSLDDKWIDISLKSDSIATSLYRKNKITEQDVCSFEIDQKHRSLIESKGMHVQGIDQDGLPRIVELLDNDFFLGTLFVPHLNSSIDRPHPLITGFLGAVRTYFNKSSR